MFDDNSIVICDEFYKKKILTDYSENKKIVNFKIININEFINKMTFNYDTKTIYYIMNKYDLKYEVALIYLKNLIYVDKDYNNKKLNELFKLKNELFDKSLINENKIFKEYINNNKIVFYNINFDIIFLNKICSKLNFEIVNDDSNISYKKEINHFNYMFDEIVFVGEKIAQLLNNNVPISKIKIVGLPSEYNYSLNLIFSFLNIPITTNKSNLYASNICKYFLDNLNSDINTTIDLLIKKYKENTIVNQIIDICNKYCWCSNFLDIKEMLIYEFKNTNIIKEKSVDEIEIINYLDIDSNSDNYYFLIGFNNENIPVSYKDTEYISDDLCSILGKETSNDRYLREKNSLIKKIRNTKNMTITYKDKTYFNEYLISNLNDELNYLVIDRGLSNTSYSKEISSLKLSGLLDKFEKYGEINSDFEKLYSSIDIDYKTYDNNYKEIDKDKMYKYLDNKLLLSYTAIDNYYKCAFKYYINSILKLDTYENSFSAYLGSLMHYILSIHKKDNFDLDKEINEYLESHKYDLSVKEKFFLDKNKEHLKFIIDELNYQKTFTDFNNELYEQKIFIEKDNKIKITLMGVIDKIMYLEKNNKTYAVVVDYKTGNIDTNLKYVKNGLQLQLPLYAYLIKNSNLFSDVSVSGLYYQKLFDSEIKSTTEEDYLKQKKSSLKLQGMSTSNEEVLSLLDSTYEDSQLIKGLKKTSNGFYAYSKVFGDMEMDNLITTVSNKIDEAINNIIEAKFDINPKQIDKDNIGCKFCKYRDICFMLPDNIQIIEEGD